MKHLKALLFVFASVFVIELANNKISHEFVSYTVAETPKADTLRGVEYNVTVTMYYAVVGQCDASPLVTADGSKIDPKQASEHKWIAVSQDLLKKNGGQLCYGDYVEIKGTKDRDGVYQVHDCMNRRFKNYIDILETEGTAGYKYKDVIITQISWTTSQENQLASL